MSTHEVIGGSCGCGQPVGHDGECIPVLRAEVERLTEKMERAVAAVAHFTHRYNQDLAMIGSQEAEIAEIHALVFNSQDETHAGLLKELAAWDRHSDANLRNLEKIERQAAEIERLNDRVTQAENQAQIIYGREFDAAMEVTRQDALIQSMREGLENAPHTVACHSNRACSISKHGCFPCNCWKSAALARTDRQ